MKSGMLEQAIQQLHEENQRDMWIADKIGQLKTAAEKANKPFNEPRATQMLIRQYQDQMAKAPRAVMLDIKAAQERKKSLAAQSGSEMGNEPGTTGTPGY